MASDDADNKPSTPETVSDKASVSQSSTSQSPAAEDRSELLDRARSFLTSPQVRHDDPSATRRFLSEKGLNDLEIEQLMREMPRQAPLVPPRTYPQPPPSNLPLLLFGLTRILTWLTGASAALILIYYRFLLPRLTQTALARRALKSHQITLISRLHSSLTSLKATQAETFAVLPKPLLPTLEDPKYSDAHSLDNLTLDKEEGSSDDNALNVPEFTLLRCAIEGCGEKKPTSEELFGLLETRFAWLKTEKGRVYQHSLWSTLTTSPHFQRVSSVATPSPSPATSEEPIRWTYVPPPPSPPPTPMAPLPSLIALRSSLRSSSPSTISSKSYQGTLQSMRDLTAYITTRTYNLLSASSSMRLRSVGGGVVGAAPESQEEEVKKEIRALKSLVLNRRTFATPTRGATPPAIVT